ncbi:hypothetical protein F2Q69_00047896 [Brassica cretica]|uniref:Transmembrane protein n=1 Tax=Brassica cretica TaxID=69181 RepID=A0A8S9PVE7_BRACR|nr:hypothetical protein F2Q69_00047896 [Brassica cretica]
MLGTTSPWVGYGFWGSDFYSSRTAQRFDDFVLSTHPSMFPHLVAAFIAVCVSVTLSFAMFVTPGSGFLGLASVLPHSVCEVLLTSKLVVVLIFRYVCLFLLRGPSRKSAMPGTHLSSLSGLYNQSQNADMLNVVTCCPFLSLALPAPNVLHAGNQGGQDG